MELRIERAAGGDRIALADLVRQHYDRVYRFCASRIGETYAEDVTQETFIVMQKRLRDFKSQSQFETWLLGIAHNLCRNQARRYRLEIGSADNWMEEMPQEANMEQRVISQESLKHALAQLSEQHREVVLLRELDGLEYAEISKMLDVPIGTVASRLNAAFKQLRDLLFTEEPLHETK